MFQRVTRPFLVRLLGALLALSLVGLASANDVEKGGQGGFNQFIVQFKPGSPAHGNGALRQRALDGPGRALGLSVNQVRRMAIGADVVRISRKLDYRAAEAFMNRLRSNPDVQYVEIDRIMRASFVPNDTFYADNQWHFFEPAGGINLPPTWDIATGTGTVVAVLDTGVTSHSDLNANVLTGYDFITDTTNGDGNGRDASASDPGDWTTANQCNDGKAAQNSSWHGTHVAGIVAAVTNNNKGMAGVAFNAKVVPVRVLGKCGGLASDISDAIVWAAGGTVAGVPANANPADVINMSLGGPGSCGAGTQAAINFAVNAGVVVVVAAGNDTDDAANYQPASCQNVIVVGASDRDGAKASFSNYGSTVDVSAPGGGEGSYVFSLSNSGTTTPTTEFYLGWQGTSQAAPHVAGVVALMQSVAPSAPDAVEGIIKRTADRPLNVSCPQGCGTGIVNALGAVTGAGSGALIVSDVSGYEGNSGTKIYTFTVSLSKAQAGNVSFDVATASSTATAGSDFTALSQTNQTIVAGATSKSFFVVVNGDTTPEQTEVFNFNVSNVTGIAVAKSQAVGIIINDDSTPLVNAVPVGPISATANNTYLYSLVVPAGKTTLNFSSSGGTGDADIYVSRDAIPSVAVSTWSSQGSTTAESVDIPTPVAGTYYVLVNAFSTISGVSLVGTYAPGDGISISVGDVSLSEGNSGTKLFTFPITLSGTSGSPVSFDVATSNGTAIAGVDYQANSVVGQSIAAGQTSANFTVTVNGDTAVEDNETFTVNLNNVAGATVADGQGQGRINNDDAALLSIGDISIAEGNSGTSTATFIVRLNTPQPNPVSYDIATSNGTATAGSDYVATSLIGRYLDSGRTTQVFEVPINGDATVEANETFNVTISNVSGAVLSDGNAVATITNDDAAAAPAVVQSFASAPVQVLDFSRSDSKLAPECRSAKSRAEARRRGKSVAHCAELPSR